MLNAVRVRVGIGGRRGVMLSGTNMTRSDRVATHTLSSVTMITV